jgi:hypothetical protein
VLVKVIDHKGAACWVNPAFVRSVRAKGKDKTAVDISGVDAPIVVRQAVDEVAGLLSLALERAGPDASRHAAITGESDPGSATRADMFSSIIVIGG